jgi:competence protein ComFC
LHLQKLQHKIRDASTALLFPAQCRVCGAMIDSLVDGVACHRCWQEVETARLDFDYCEKCDASLPRLKLQAQARRCGRCEEFAFMRSRACGLYKGALRESVLWLKLQPHFPLYLKQLLLTTFWQLSQTQEIDVILPVPLHSAREKDRKFNQAEVIAFALSQATGLPLCKTALAREQDTERHRAGMDSVARMKSLAGVFVVRAPRLIKNRSVLLVDDVMTTGSTAHEIAQTLLNNGAQAVQVLVLARAITHFL